MVVVAVLVFLLGLCAGALLDAVARRLADDEAPARPWSPLEGRAPIVAAVTALLWLAVLLARWDDAADVVRGIALVTLMVPVTLIDLETRKIPNKLTYPFALLAVVITLVLDSSDLVEFLVAGAAAYLFFLIAILAYPKGMGGGDMKLAGVMGLALGRAVAPAIVVALIAGVVVGSVVIARKGVADGRKTAIPFGPFLALGAVIAVFFGEAIADGYVDTL